MSLDGYGHDHRLGAHPEKQSEHESHMHSGAGMQAFSEEGRGQISALEELEGHGLGYSQRQPNIGADKSVRRPDKGFRKG